MAAPLQSHDHIKSTQHSSNTSVESKDPIAPFANGRSSPFRSNHGSGLVDVTAEEAEPNERNPPTVQGLNYASAPASGVPPPPPPPKAREVVKTPEHYALGRASASQAASLQTYRPRVSSVSLCSKTRGSMDASWSSGGNPLQQRQSRRRAQSLSEGTKADNLEHPPGYSQNPYAMEMTAEQRVLTTHEDQSEQCLPLPNNTRIRRSSVSTLWRRARRDTESLVDMVHDWFSDGF
ncbi:MAG: hypothetical protein Q9216_004103 [Gyalolechia sp. 2 TL-2023]